MGWFIAIPMFIVGCVTRDVTIMMVAGVFAIAGSISFGSSVIASKIKKREE